MSRRPRPVHRDRSISVSDHAVARCRERSGTGYLHEEECRLLIADAYRQALRTKKLEPHYVRDQQRVLLSVLGVELYAVVGKNMTGWGHGDRAICTMLTPEQVQRSEHGDGPKAQKRVEHLLAAAGGR